MTNLTQYGIMIKSELNGKPYFEIGSTFDLIGQAEDYVLATPEDSNFAIVAINLLTGNTVTIMTRDQIANMIDRAAAEELHAELEDAVYGSYEQQHRMRTRELVGA